jgi:hypothetical protein
MENRLERKSWVFARPSALFRFLPSLGSGAASREGFTKSPRRPFSLSARRGSRFETPPFDADLNLRDLMHTQ